MTTSTATKIRKETTTTQLSLNDIREQIAKLEDVKVMICDTWAYTQIVNTINTLKEQANSMADGRVYIIK